MSIAVKNRCKQGTLFIMAGDSTAVDYCGLKNEGYTVLTPYKDRGIFGRILRELCFKMRIQKPWYNRDFHKYIYNSIIVRDPLITNEYLHWLASENPKVKINFVYANIIGRAKHLTPDAIPSVYKVWTYDAGDSEKYNISLIKSKTYYRCFVYPKRKSKYDILFVGRDKGRIDYLLELKQQFEMMGLRTKFLITADGRFAKWDKRYGKPVPYTQIAEWISESKAILNVALPGQRGITIRDMEAVFNKVKLITTNKHIIDSEIYDENNVFILQDLQLSGVEKFINEPYHDCLDIQNRFSIENYVNEITETKKE